MNQNLILRKVHFYGSPENKTNAKYKHIPKIKDNLQENKILTENPEPQPGRESKSSA